PTRHRLLVLRFGLGAGGPCVTSSVPDTLETECARGARPLRIVGRPTQRRSCRPARSWVCPVRGPILFARWAEVREDASDAPALLETPADRLSAQLRDR